MSALPLLADAPFQPRPLRDHQRRAIDLLSSSYLAGHRRTVLELATGAGKTRIAAEIVNRALAKGKRVCFTVPAISLIDQTVAAFEGEGIEFLGVIQANHPRTHYGAPVQIASVQTLGVPPGMSPLGAAGVGAGFGGVPLGIPSTVPTAPGFPLGVYGTVPMIPPGVHLPTAFAGTGYGSPTMGALPQFQTGVPSL